MVTLGEYIFARLQELKADSIFGVPGDFNLALLDYVEKNKDITWVGDTNELNAGYAADGYARLKGFAALITTFGVGELSALAAVAGSYAEHVPVAHIVGVPSLGAQKNKFLLHHTLGNGDFSVFQQMSSNISEHSVMLTDPLTAPHDIDLALRICVTTARPVYISIPCDLYDKELESGVLSKPLDLSLKPNDKEVEGAVVKRIVDAIKHAKKGAILVDACASRHHVLEETKKLVELTQFPVYITPMGKGSIDESSPLFSGVYVGRLTEPTTKENLESSDLVLGVGSLLSDFNTGSFSYAINKEDIIEFHSDHMKIGYAEYPGVQMKLLFKNLLPLIPQAPKRSSQPKLDISYAPADKSDITHDWLWKRLSDFLQPGDTVVTETGTSSFGINETRFPPGTKSVSQVLWGSIGYSVGAVFGAALASRELDASKRVILFVGDGSLQLTATEISSMIRNGVKPILFIINNDGYTIERMIHGLHAKYNDIQMWKNTQLLDTFSARGADFKTYQVRTKIEIDQLFKDKEFGAAKKIQLVELFMPMLDAPASLIKQGEITNELNSKV